jgi:hypothetical protein
VLRAVAGAEPPAATIDDLAWIAGRWQGEALNGRFEETWNRPSGGTMVGMFKLVRDEGAAFYEILTIVPRGESLALRLKHFTADLVGWEEKDQAIEFPLVKLTDREAYFDGLTFRRIHDNAMDIFVVIQQPNGEASEVRFACRRSGPIPSDDATSTKERVAPREAIDRVLEMDALLSRQRNRLCQHQSLAAAVQAYVLGIDCLDFGPCPDRFSQAFRRHRDAWNDSIEFLRKHDSLRGEMHELFAQIERIDEAGRNDLKRHADAISATWNEVVAAAETAGQ